MSQSTTSITWIWITDRKSRSRKRAKGKAREPYRTRGHHRVRQAVAARRRPRAAACLADALRNSPHLAADASVAGDNRVTFTTLAGLGFALTLQEPVPTRAEPRLAPVLTEALAAAILNHPAFVTATPDNPLQEDSFTVQTRDGLRYLLVLEADPDADTDEHAAPAEELADTADRILTSNPSGSERATADLLTYIAATWDKHDLPLRQHAQALARSLAP